MADRYGDECLSTLYVSRQYRDGIVPALRGTKMTYSTKMVDGNSVPLSAKEVAELEQRDSEWAAGAAVREAEAARLAELSADAAVVDLAKRLANATSAQIDTWFANNVTNAA
jgi:hypothetical protein